MSTMLDSLPALACVGAGIVAGVFLAFSRFVMRALREWPACHGVAAMQRVNVGVLNPGFLAVFVGTAVLAGVCVLAAGLLAGLCARVAALEPCANRGRDALRRVRRGCMGVLSAPLRR
jgi:uncharacterized membrane protein